jgi:uncharacterized protein (DUF2141 family)
MALRSRRTLNALALLVVAMACPPVVAEDPPGILIVEITGLKEASGDVYIAVFDSDATFLGDEAVQATKVVIAEALDGDVVRTELQLPLGEYAFSAFHDMDGNGELDTNFVGMPKEPIAMSNNAVGKFGPPKYEDAVFTLGVEPVIQRVIMREM